jgi:chromosome segregation ATPase
LVAAAEANEPVLVHPDWRQAEIDALAEERDQLKEKVRMLTLVSRHETLVAEAYRLENIIKETSKERDELNEKLATEKSIREQLQRDLDYAERQYIELRRQFDVVVNDRNTLRARCDELERGDRYSCGFKCGQQEERRAVVAWLNKNPQGWARQWSLAGRIERGEHDV